MPGPVRFMQIRHIKGRPILEVVYVKDGKYFGQRYQFDLKPQKGELPKAKPIGEPESIKNLGQFNFKVVEAKGNAGRVTPAVQ